MQDLQLDGLQTQHRQHVCNRHDTFLTKLLDNTAQELSVCQLGILTVPN